MSGNLPTETDAFRARCTEFVQDRHAGELKPCPFCGAPGRRAPLQLGAAKIECSNEACGCGTVVLYTLEDRWARVISAWNRRPPSEPREAASLTDGQRHAIDFCRNIKVNGSSMILEVLAKECGEAAESMRIARQPVEPAPKYIEIGVMVELDDGLQTRMIDWYDERQGVLAGAKIYAVQPSTKEPKHG